MCELPPQRIGRHEVDESLLPVDLDDGDQFPIARFQLLVSVDGNLLELESELIPELGDSRARPLAQVAIDRVVQAD